MQYHAMESAHAVTGLSLKPQCARSRMSINDYDNNEATEPQSGEYCIVPGCVSRSDGGHHLSFHCMSSKRSGNGCTRKNAPVNRNSRVCCTSKDHASGLLGVAIDTLVASLAKFSSSGHNLHMLVGHWKKMRKIRVMMVIGWRSHREIGMNTDDDQHTKELEAKLCQLEEIKKF